MLAVLYIISGVFGKLTVNAGNPPEERITETTVGGDAETEPLAGEGGTEPAAGELPAEEGAAEELTEEDGAAEGSAAGEEKDKEMLDKEMPGKETSTGGEETEDPAEDAGEEDPAEAAEKEKPAESSDEEVPDGTPADGEGIGEEPDGTPADGEGSKEEQDGILADGEGGQSEKGQPELPDEPPMFSAKVEYSPQGWIVKGLFKDFALDTEIVQPMCSIDGETYHDCGQGWNLQWLGSEEEGVLEKLQGQRCLFGSEEPFRSYLAGELDRFYIKLRIVRQGGIAYESQAAVIGREEPQPVPAEFDVAAKFAPGMFVREGRPPNIQCYGRYQITVSEDAAAEEIAAFLPETLPVEIQLQEGSDYAGYIGNDIVECHVEWKPLDLPPLTAGESVTVPDAAEGMVIPAGTVLYTQTGIYQVEEPIGICRE